MTSGPAWKESMRVDVTSVDTQHEQLLEAIGRLRQLLDEGADQETCIEHFDRINKLVREHFAHEERVMRNIGLPGFQRHKEIHDKLLEDLNAYRTRFIDHFDPEGVQAVYGYLAFWLFRHMTTDAAEIGRHIHRDQDAG